MRIFFSTTFITLALLIGAAGAVPAAHAQFEALVDSPLTEQQANQAANSAITGSNNSKAFTDPKLKGAEEGFGTIMIWIMSLFAWLVGVAALLLDYAVYFTVVKMGSYVNSLSAIGVTWRVLRDIGNIMLIFGFLAAGIATILNTEFYGWKTKMLPMLLVAAVFINFSLFISEAIVDTGNLFATQFYTQINGGDPAGLKDFDTGSITLSNEGISNKLMAQLGLQSIYGEVSNTEKAAEILKAGNSWVIGFMGVILFMVTAFVLFSLAFVLIARFVALVFLLIVAPIGFAGLAIPGFAARAKQWWTTLLEQTITAPILLLMLYIALAVITDAQFLTGFCLPGESTITGAVNTNTTCTVNAIGWVSGNFQGFASFILSFLVAIVLLLAVIVYAKRWSAFGGDWASRTAGKLTFGATAWAGRSSVGWLSQRASEGWRKTSLSRAPVLGRAVAGAFDRGAKGSFDLRGTGALKSIPFGSNIAAGDAQKGGFREWEKGKIKEREEYAKTLEQTTGRFWGLPYAKGEEGREKDAKTAKSTAETEAKEIKSRNEGQMRELLAAHKVDQQPFNERVDAAKKALTTAQNTGNRQTIAAAQLALNNVLLDSQKKREEQRIEREELKKVHEQLVKTKEEEISALEENIKGIKQAPQLGYAKGLRLGLSEDNIINKVVNPKRNTKGADNIIKAATKSKSDKDFDTLKELLEKNAKEAEKKPEEKKPEAPTQ